MTGIHPGTMAAGVIPDSIPAGAIPDIIPVGAIPAGADTARLHTAAGFPQWVALPSMQEALRQQDAVPHRLPEAVPQRILPL